VAQLGGRIYPCLYHITWSVRPLAFDHYLNNRLGTLAPSMKIQGSCLFKGTYTPTAISQTLQSTILPLKMLKSINMRYIHMKFSHWMTTQMLKIMSKSRFLNIYLDTNFMDTQSRAWLRSHCLLETMAIQCEAGCDLVDAQGTKDTCP